jgi:antirestriction protein ArdC
VRRDRALVELQAEAVAHVVCESLGLATNHAGADYIALWGGSKDKLRQSLAAIHQAAGAIVIGIGWEQPKERRKEVTGAKAHR